MPSSNCGPGHPLSTELGLARAHVSQECDGGTVPAQDLRGLAAGALAGGGAGSPRGGGTSAALSPGNLRAEREKAFFKATEFGVIYAAAGTQNTLNDDKEQK